MAGRTVSWVAAAALRIRVAGSSSLALGQHKHTLNCCRRLASTGSVPPSTTSEPPGTGSVSHGTGSVTASSTGSEVTVGSSLLKQFQDQIRMTGPLTLHQYMRAVLTHPRGGYYMHGDVLGQQGDFITSPEISQMFGELMGVWVYSEWLKMGRESPLLLLELGPGRGTLMKDILRVLARFGLTGDAVHVHLVEISPHYQQLQRRTLCGDEDSGIAAPQHTSPQTGMDSSSPSMPSSDNTSSPTIDGSVPPGRSSAGGSPVHWHEFLSEVPLGFTITLAHEFLDVLPIHRLLRGEHGWRELLVDINGDVGYGGYGDAAAGGGAGDAAVDGDSGVAAAAGSGDAAAAVDANSGVADAAAGGGAAGDAGIRAAADVTIVPEGAGESRSPEKMELPLRYVLSREKTPAAVLYTKEVEGRDSLEVCPDAAVIMKQLSERITERGGAVLVVDYGHDGTRGDTFRAFRQHRQQHPLADPGSADLTADVDFSLLKKELPDTVVSYGPVSQGFFLKNMGIELRLMHLLKNCSDQRQHAALVSDYQRLVGELGAAYKMFAVYPAVMKEILLKYPPPGFFRELNPGPQEDDEQQQLPAAGTGKTDDSK